MFDSRIGGVHPLVEAEERERRREIQRRNEQVSIGWAPMLVDFAEETPELDAVAESTKDKLKVSCQLQWKVQPKRFNIMEALSGIKGSSCLTSSPILATGPR